jgi:hypothetical protein
MRSWYDDEPNTRSRLGVTRSFVLGAHCHSLRVRRA